MAMISILLAATLYTAAQGSAVQVKVPNEPRTKSVQVMWNEKRVPAFRLDDVWTTLLGVDLDAKPGTHAAEALLTMDDGSVKRREIAITVAAREFPVTRLTVEPRFTQLSKTNLNRSGRESREVGAIYRRITTDLAPDEVFVVPIPGGTGRNFGERRVFNGQARAPHSGADLRAATGTPVHATNRGRVVLAKELFFTGNTVIVDHGLGIYSLYAHLSRIDVTRGVVVKSDQIVGLAGATGRVTGPHLHWAIRMQGARIDPFTLVKGRAEAGPLSGPGPPSSENRLVRDRELTPNGPKLTGLAPHALKLALGTQQVAGTSPVQRRVAPPALRRRLKGSAEVLPSQRRL